MTLCFVSTNFGIRYLYLTLNSLFMVGCCMCFAISSSYILEKKQAFFCEVMLPTENLLTFIGLEMENNMYKIKNKQTKKNHLSIICPSDLRSIVGLSVQIFWCGLHAFQRCFSTETACDRQLVSWLEVLYTVSEDILRSSTDISLIFPTSCTQFHGCGTWHMDEHSFALNCVIYLDFRVCEW